MYGHVRYGVPAEEFDEVCHLVSQCVGERTDGKMQVPQGGCGLEGVSPAQLGFQNGCRTKSKTATTTGPELPT